MQISIDIPIFIVFFEVLIAFLFVIAFGLIRFSKGVMYRLWSAAWIIFTATTAFIVLNAAAMVGLTIFDIVPSGGLMITALLLLDGAREKRRASANQTYLYPIAYIVGIVLVPVGIVLAVPYTVLFTPIALLVAYSCYYSVLKFNCKSPSKDLDSWFLIIGFLLWGTSMLLFPINIFVDMIDVTLLTTTTGLIMTGVGMLNIFIRDTSENLRIQNSLTQLISGIINHDIRNYVATLQESIDQMQTSTDDQRFWLDLSANAVSSMSQFIEEIRHISAGISRYEAERIPIELSGLLEDVRNRVTREYELTPDAITIAVGEQVTVLSSTIVRELLWNILDNSFKHRGKHLDIQEIGGTDDLVTIAIHDDAGGIHDEILKFLNDPESLSSKEAPGMGLGIILIKGLSMLCGVRLEVEHIGEEDQLVGTAFRLQFDRVPSIAG